MHKFQIFFNYLQLVEGQSLPPPERLKHKILIKDKKVRRGANTSMTNLTGTLQRGTHLPSVPEEMEGMADGGTSKDTKVRFDWLFYNLLNFFNFLAKVVSRL